MPLLSLLPLPLPHVDDQLAHRCLIPNVSPGPAIAARNDKAAKAGVTNLTLTLSNKALVAAWKFEKGPGYVLPVGSGRLANRLTGHEAFVGQPEVTGNQSWNVTLRSRQEPRIEKLTGNPNATQIAARCSGQRLVETYDDDAHHIQVEWSVTLLDDSNYLRQEVTIRSTEGDAPITQVLFSDRGLLNATVQGKVKGSPVANDEAFFGMEQPMAESSSIGDYASSTITRVLPINKGVPVTYSAVYGVSPKGQLRRAFLNYIERERARPYQPFLHYNSWYDIGYFNPYNQADCLDSINAFGQELVQKRGVKMDSFLFDDGWDDYSTVWKFHSGFPNGFTPLKEAAAKYGAAPGVWLSPWGGYGKPREQRLATGKIQGYEIDSEGYALSGPKYFERFKQVCMDFVTKYGVNQFKLDGTGSPNKQYPGSKFASDFEAAIELIRELREAQPNLFINLTTGTWPSPFWLRYADSTWRGGDDHSFLGAGTKRQQWITYRDSDTYDGVAQKGWLYPLNSLMLHGLIYAQYAQGLNSDPDGDFESEVHDYFGNGTQLQEMYITHKLLSNKNWDTIAEAAKWSRDNQDVLVDTHWIGGDPRKGEIYGWASWSPRKGILVLRNPGDKGRWIDIDVKKMFELSDQAPKTYVGHSPWAADIYDKPRAFRSGITETVALEPFQVLVLDLTPVN